MAWPDPGNLSYSPFGPATNQPKMPKKGGVADIRGIWGLLKGLSGGNKQALTSGTGLEEATPEPSNSLEDQILALKMAAIDAQYGGSGGGGAAYTPGKAPAMETYMGPTIEQIRQLSNTGRGNITGSFGDLAAAYGVAIPQTASTYGQSQQAANTGYAQAAQNIEAAKAKGQAALNEPQTSAGAAAAKEAQAKVAAIADRYTNTNAANQWNAGAMTNAMAQAQGAVGQGRVQAANTRGADTLMRWVAGTNLQDAQAKLGMQKVETGNAIKKGAYEQEENIRRQAFAEKQAEAAASQEGKKQAAKLNLLAKVLGAQDKTGKGLTGVQGVLAYGNQQKNPKAATSFLKMIADARANTLEQNQKALADVSGMTKKTTAQEQLQMLMSGTEPDTSNPQAMIDLIRKTPELKGLEKYAVWAPQQLYGNKQGLEELYPGYGKATEDWMQKAGRLGVGRGALEQKLRDQLAKQFQPSFNMRGLQSNAADYSLWNNYLKQQQDASDLYNSMWEIYQGKWGKGGL